MATAHPGVLVATRRRRGASLLVAALAAAASLGGCGEDDAPGPHLLEGGLPVDVEVAVVDFGFEPAEVRIEPGGVVEFELTGEADHTVTARGENGPGRFDSGVLLPGETFTVVLDEPGRHDYACRLHPQMQGTIVVAGAGADGEQRPGTGSRSAGPG